MSNAGMFERFLDECQGDDGIALVSEHRSYHHDEQRYDAQYRIDSADFLAGEGLYTLVQEESIDLRHGVLELGCGTGRLSVGLVRHFEHATVAVTDASSSFLRLVRDKLDANGLRNYRLALLRFEDIDRIPDNSLSMVVLRSALHHVLDYETFILQVARKLVRGGAMVFQEPSYDGFLVMGLIAEYVLARLPEDVSETSRQIRLFADTMRFYCRRDVDKSMAEDKHVFRLADILRVSDLGGLRLRAFPNRDFESFARPTVVFDFRRFVDEYLRYCMAFSDEAVETFRVEAEPMFAFLSDVARGAGVWPDCSAVTLLRKM